MAVDARVRLSLIGGRRIARALRGLRRTTAQTNQSARQESARTKRAVEGDQRSEQRTTQQTGRTTELVENRKRRSARRTERERQRSFREEVQRQRRLIRQERQLANARRQAARAEGPGRLRRMAGAAGRGAMVLGGGALGGARAAFGVARGLQQTLGVRSQESIIGGAVESRQNFIRAAVQGGLRGPQIQGAIARSAAIGQRTGVSPESIMQGIGVAQERFSQLLTATSGGEAAMNDFFTNIEFMAQVSRTTGASMEDVVGAAGEFQRQFGLDAEGTRDALALISEGALQGSLSLRDFAERFPAAIANFQGARGTTGLEALREFSAIAQAMRASGADPRVVRTQQRGLLSALSNRGTQRNLRRLGLNVRDSETGNLRNLGSIISEAAANPRLANLGVMTAAFGNQQAAEGFGSLRLQEQRAVGGQAGSMTLQERIDVDIGHGSALFSDTMEELNADASGDIIRQRIEREARLIAESDELIRSFGRLSNVLTQLEDENPLLTTVGLPIAGGVAQGLGIAALLSRLTGGAVAASSTAGAGILASSAGGTGLAAAGGTGIMAASGGMIAAATGAGILIAGAVTAAISATGLFEDDRGRSLLDQVVDIPDDAGSAFAEGFFESIGNAISGPSLADSPEVTRSRRKDTMRLDPGSINALGEVIGSKVGEPGAGRREEGSPGR